MISRAETSGVRGTTATTRLTLSAPLRLKMRLASSRSARFLSCICLAWFLRLNLLLDAVTLALVVFGCDLSEGRCVRPFAASLSELLDECFDLNGLFVWLCVGRCENAEGGAGGAIARGSRGRREESKPLSAEEKIGATAFGAKSDFCQIGTPPPGHGGVRRRSRWCGIKWWGGMLLSVGTLEEEKRSPKGGVHEKGLGKDRGAEARKRFTRVHKRCCTNTANEDFTSPAAQASESSC